MQALSDELAKERAAREALKDVVSAAESMLRVARARISVLERHLKENKSELEAARRKHKDLEQLVKYPTIFNILTIFLHGCYSFIIILRSVLRPSKFHYIHDKHRVYRLELSSLIIYCVYIDLIYHDVCSSSIDTVKQVTMPGRRNC